VEVRTATAHDVPAIIALDPIASCSTRAEFIQRSVQSAICLVAIEATKVVAYGVLDYTFFSQGYVSMLYVAPSHRRRGIGTALMRNLEALCATDRLFTSTNQSNQPMQALLPRLGYVASGTVQNLDEGDPELIYFKRIRPQSA
jgi:ribosomal protein S18 acetylase RimI-like enzyme